MVTRWSFNIDGLDIDEDVWNLLLQDAKQNPPSYVTIMDSKDRAKQWRNEVPSTQVIYRTYDGLDNYYHENVTPINAAIQLERDHSDMRDVWHYYRVNEPGGEWRKYQDWIIRFAQEAKARGFKVTAGGLALGKNWHTPDEIQGGLADALLDYAIANEDSFLLDAHEYVTGTLWSPQIQSYPSALFDRNLLLANENIPVLTDSYQGYQNFTNWGLFRVCWLANARSLERHGKRLNCVINEGLFDFNAHIIQSPHDYSTLPNGQRVKTEDEIRKYGEDRYLRDVRGVLGHWLYLSWVFTGKMQKVSEPEYCDMIIRNFKFAERAYPSNIRGIMLFAINKDWEVPEGHDYSPIIRTLLPKMKSLAIAPTTPIPSPVPSPTPTPIETINKRIRAAVDGLRIRKVPSLAGTVIGYLPRTYVDAKYGKNVLPNTVDNRDWRFIEYTPDGSDNVLSGYVADEFIEVENNEIVLSALEKDLVLAYRQKDYEAILALLANPQIVLLSGSEPDLIAAYRQNDIKALLQYVIGLIESDTESDRA